MKYYISRFEEQGGVLFICINSENNPVYLEHFFTEEEKADREGTIIRLVAELEFLDESYKKPLNMVDKLTEIFDIKIDSAQIDAAKEFILSEKARIETENEAILENQIKPIHEITESLYKQDDEI